MSTSTTPRRSGNGTKILATLAVLAMAGGIFTVASLALFTDQAVTDANTFSTGNIDISTSPATAALTMPAMAPGDQVTAPLTVSNDGTLDFRYAMTSFTTEDVLASQLVLTVKESVTTCDDTNWSLTGTDIYSGVLGSSATTAMLGSNAQGNQAGDRTLAPGTNEVLCFNVTLPLTATNAVEGLTTTADFTFDAEQTSNNP